MPATATPLRIDTPLPTLTPTGDPILFFPAIAVTAKKVFLVYSISHGDGGYDFSEAFLDYGQRPKLIIYTDGQALFAEGKGYREAMLSASEMCDLLTQLDELGGYQGPLYALPTPEIGFHNGEPSEGFAISGNPISSWSASINEWLYLTEEYKAPMELIKNYRPPGNKTHSYRSNRVMLWLGQIAGNRPTDKAAGWREWFSGSPLSLQELLGSRRQGFAFLQDEYAALLADEPLFDLFSEGDYSYVVMSRPLLPHEMPEQFLTWPSGEPIKPVPYSELPFQCGG